MLFSTTPVNSQDYGIKSKVQSTQDKILGRIRRLKSEPGDPQIKTFNVQMCQDTKSTTHHAIEVMMSCPPSDVAHAMLTMKPVKPAYINSVSLLFVSIENYEELRGCLAPDILFRYLNRVYNKYDCLTAIHQVQLVDFNDGCCFVAANCRDDQHSDHALRLSRFALDAIAAVEETPIAEDVPHLGRARARAGMHCGAVAACLLGAHGGIKHTLVGHAVNLASRMKSHGLAGAAHCSAAAAALITEQSRGRGLRLTPRAEPVDVKGLGRLRTFWLAVSPPDSDAASSAGDSDSGSGAA